MQNSGKSFNNKLVYAIAKHPYWGLIIEPYNVKITKKEQFSYDAKKITQNNIDVNSNTSETDLRLFELIDKYSDEAILRMFGSHKERMIDFLSRMDEAFVEKHIRPFIEKKIVNVIEMLSDSSIDIYYKGAPENLIDENPISIIETPVNPIFYFEKNNNETRYYLTLQANSENISLTNKYSLILTNQPCLLLLGRNIYKFEGNFYGKKLIPFFDKEHITIPVKHEKKYFESFIRNTIKHYKVTAKGFRIDEIHKDPDPLLSLEADWQEEPVLSLSFKYDDKTFIPSDNELCQVDVTHQKNGEYCYTKVNRKPEKEKIYSGILQEMGMVKLNPTHYTIPVNKSYEGKEDFSEKCYNLIDWIAEHKEMLEKNGFILLQNYFEERYFIGKPGIDFKTEEKSDWFDIKGHVTFGKHKIPFVNLRNNILKGEREYILPDNTIGLIPEEWFERFSDVITYATKSSDGLTIKKHYYALLENLDAVDKKDNIKGVPFRKEGLPNTLMATMRPYQLTGFQWLYFLYNNKFGGCFADDMGLGKTVQTLALLLKIKESNNGADIVNFKNKQNFETLQYNDDPMQLDLFSDEQGKTRKASLIIMPLSLIHNWINEIEKFAPSLKYFHHIGANRPQSTSSFSRYDLILTTYGTIRSDIDMFKECSFYCVILDESQVIKNAESKIFKAVKQLKGDFRLVLTGTPIENSLTDLWSQFSFINPGMLGSLNNFKNEFVNPIERKNDELKKQKLQNLVKPFVLRRTKGQVAKELPDLTEKIYYCEMTEEQSDFYERKKSEARNLILDNYQTIGKNKTKFILLSSLTKLRLIANHPVIIENSYEKDSGKFLEVIYNINNVLQEHHKVLLFSQFVKHLNLFADYFKENNIPFSMLTGKVGEKERKSLIDKFQNDSSTRVFLISLRAGGVGLNLTGADYVFMLDPWWNPAVESQAINRAHRIGQDKKVFVYKFITRASVEEKIMALQKNKSQLADSFINQNNPLRSMQVDELMTLL